MSGNGRPSDPPPGGAWPTLAALEADYIRRVLARTGGRIAGPRGAARILGLHPNTLRSLMQRRGVATRRPTYVLEPDPPEYVSQ